jgi:hypothetical protein
MGVTDNAMRKRSIYTKLKNYKVHHFGLGSFFKWQGNTERDRLPSLLQGRAILDYRRDRI